MLMAAKFKRISFISLQGPFLHQERPRLFPLYQFLQAGATSDTFRACNTWSPLQAGATVVEAA
jgi:hypothetical protein